MLVMRSNRIQVRFIYLIQKFSDIVDFVVKHDPDGFLVSIHILMLRYLCQ